MGDILTEREIDELLYSLSSSIEENKILAQKKLDTLVENILGAIDGSVDKETLKNAVYQSLYLMKKDIEQQESENEVIERALLRNFERMFDCTVGHMQEALQKYLPLTKSIRIEVVNAETVTINDYFNSMISPFIVSSFQVQPLKGYCLFETSMNVYKEIMRQICFDCYDFSKDKSIDRLLLLMYLNITKNMLEHVVDIFHVIDSEKDFTLTNIDLIRTVFDKIPFFPPSEKIVLVVMRIAIVNEGGQEIEGLMTFAIPYFMIDGYIETIVADDFFTKWFYE